MGYPTKIQLIAREKGNQWYVNFPNALAEDMNFKKSETIDTMEDVLEIYQRPYDLEQPVICMDESSKQHLKEVRAPLPLKPGTHERFDSEYERNGTSNIFMFFEPLAGKRYINVTDSRTAIDWAFQIRNWIINILQPSVLYWLWIT